MRTSGFNYALAIGAAAELLAGCGGSQPPSGAAGAMPRLAFARSAMRGIEAPGSARRGVYVGLDTARTNTTVLGYAPTNRRNKGPICTETPGLFTGDVAVDDRGNLMVTAETAGEVLIYKGPEMCGALLGTLRTSALSLDVASADAVNGKIIVGNVQTFNPSDFGDIEICTLSDGCGTSITNQNINSVYGVALARNGDCWASASSLDGGTILVYFKGCSASGQIATGFKNEYPGGLDIDSDGNLVSVDSQQFWVYKGCKPKCTLVGGPFAAEGYAVFGHLNKQSTQFVAGDSEYNQIDVYAYSPHAMTYEYSFNNGISINGGGDFIGAAYNPRSKE